MTVRDKHTHSNKETEPPITIATFRAPSGLSDSTSGSASASPTSGSPRSQQIAPPSSCERRPHGFDLSDRKFIYFTGKDKDDYDDCSQQPCPHFHSASIPCPQLTEDGDETLTLIIPTITRYFPFLVPLHVSTPQSFACTHSPLDMHETNIEEDFEDAPPTELTTQQRLALIEQSIQQQQTLTYHMTQLLSTMATRSNSSAGHKPLAKVNPPPTFDGNRANGRAFLDAAEVYVAPVEVPPLQSCP
ncbi:hypothetical protein GGG16DRAFT_129812 [Schizophyllum commune]